MALSGVRLEVRHISGIDHWEEMWTNIYRVCPTTSTAIQSDTHTQTQLTPPSDETLAPLDVCLDVTLLREARQVEQCPKY